MYQARELRAERIRMGLSTAEVSRMLNISPDLYRKKERGAVRFSDSEKVVLTSVLCLNFELFNRIFFNGELFNIN